MTFGSRSARRATGHSILNGNGRLARGLTLAALLGSSASIAVAQAAAVPVSPDTPAQEPAAPPNPGTTPPAAPEQGLGAIIVTATKVATNLQRTPIAISVATS